MARHTPPGTAAALISALAALLLCGAAAAERRPLKRQELKIAGREGVYRVRQDPASGDFVFSWTGMSGQGVEATYVPGHKVDAVVEAEVEPEETAHAWRFRYRLSSLGSSRQRAFTLVVETSGAVFGIQAPEGWYSGALSFAPAISWSDTRPESLGLTPGGTAKGFSFKAARADGKQSFQHALTGEPGVFFHRGSLPGIVRCWVRGYTEVFSAPEEVPEGLAESLPGLLGDSVTGLTVGPVAIPTPFDPAAFVDTLEAYHRIGREAGWISGEAAVERHGEILDQLRQALEEQRRDTARSLLLRLASAAQRGREEGELTAEAYALLKYNAEYLRKTLKKNR